MAIGGVTAQTGIIVILFLCVISVVSGENIEESTLNQVENANKYGDNTVGLPPTNFPFQNTSLSWDERVEDLVGRLTLEELINQSVAHYGHAVPAIPRLGIKSFTYLAECLRGYKDHNATAFPQSLGLAAAFSADLVHAVGTATGEEVRAYHNHGDVTANGLTCFSPVINILRHPLWGRNQETYGEDPYLSGQLGAAYVSGLQGNDSRYLQVSAGCKHFDAHGGPDNIPIRKFKFNAEITERDLEMTFLPQFEACMKAQPHNVMCSFNSINGIPSCANKWLLTDLLRQRWQYKGFVISDDAAVVYINTQHNYTKTITAAAVEAVTTGCNVELVGKYTPAFWSLPQAVDQKKISEATLRNNLKPVLCTRMKLGEFDPVSMNPYTKIPMSVVLSKEHQDLALEAAMKSFVLMKNDGNVLPITRRLSTISIVGPLANDTTALMGDYTANPPTKLIVTPLQGLHLMADHVKYSSGCDNPVCKNYTSVKETVQGSDLVVVCLGTGITVEMENNDRTDINLPGSQLQLLQDAVKYSNGKPVILLLFNGGPLDISWAKTSPSVSVIMECFFPAMATGPALYRVLTDVNSSPGGRLPLTWPTKLDQVPPITNYTMKGRTYRYYTTDPLYPFGYGLSYTKFSYGNLAVTPTSITPGQDVKVTVNVANVGSFNADEVTQVYISWPKATVEVPRWQLVAFRRTLIPAHHSVSLDFTVTAKQTMYWLDSKRHFQLEPGELVLYVGGQQPHQTTAVPSNVLSAKISVKTA